MEASATKGRKRSPAGILTEAPPVIGRAVEAVDVEAVEVPQPARARVVTTRIQFRYFHSLESRMAGYLLSWARWSVLTVASYAFRLGPARETIRQEPLARLLTSLRNRRPAAIDRSAR